MKKNNISLVTAGIFCLVGVSSLHALKTDKLEMKNNYIIKYKKIPQAVTSFDEMFSEGIVYGRLRSNTFWFDHKNENPGKTQDNFAWGVGGSLTYSTGYLNGFGATAGMYTTHTIATDNTDSLYPGVDFTKAGKDTYSRAVGSGAHIDVLAVGYVEYKFSKSDIKLGRQIFESTMLRSNDSKMIPNTFEGVAIESDDLADTNMRLAYFTRQKLRDHRDFHSIIAVDGWDQNDDAAFHKGLSVANINAVGEDSDPGMLVATLENKSLEGLKLNFDGMYIDGFFSSAIAEVNYKIKLGDGWTLAPGARYIHQMDEGAGKIGGAALTGAFGLDKVGADAPTADALASYDDSNSVDGGAWMARLKLSKGAGSVMAGYSSVLDKADLIAPWRGFPTGGYTRSMAQYNWEANTRSWMIQGMYDFGKAGILNGLRGSLDYAYMDYDQTKIDAKTIGKTDRDIIHLDLFQTFESSPNLELKFRMASVNADASPASEDYNSYNEYRFEVNYFF